MSYLSIGEGILFSRIVDWIYQTIAVENTVQVGICVFFGTLYLRPDIRALFSTARGQDSDVTHTRLALGMVRIYGL